MDQREIRRERAKKIGILGLVFLLNLLLVSGTILARPLNGSEQPMDIEETAPEAKTIEPATTEPPVESTEPVTTEPPVESTEPVPTAPTEPVPTEPTPTEPTPTEPTPTEPTPTEPTPTDPTPTEPTPTPTQPTPTQPTPTQPAPTQPTPTQPAPHTHHYTEVSRTGATCTENGVIQYQCSCGASYQDVIPAKGHSFVQNRVEPGYGTAGYVEIVCSACGFVRQRTEIPALTLDAPKIESIEIGETGVILTWNALEPAQEYKIYRKAESDSEWKQIGKVEADQLSFEDRTLKAGVPYQYAVSQCTVIQEETVESPLGSNWMSFLLPFTAPVLLEPEIGEGGVVLSWEPVLGADGYVVYRMDEAGQWADLRSVQGGSRTSYVDSQVEKGNTYTYTVKAYSKYQGSLRWGVYEEDGVSIDVGQISFTFSTFQAMRVLWQSKREGMYLHLLIHGQDGLWRDWNESVIYMAEWEEEDVEDGKCIWAMKLPKTALDAPVLLEVKPDKGNAVIRWNTLSGISGYCIERKAEGETWTEMERISDPSQNTWTDSELTDGTRFFYRIRAYRTEAEETEYSDYSNNSYSITIRQITE